MRRVLSLTLALLSAFVIAGCSRMEGLQLLTGQTADGQQNADATVESLDLVMADKTGVSDPTLVSAADRIEQASESIDIIEIRQDVDTRIFQVTMLWLPPQVDTATQEGQVAYLDGIRRAMELTWQGTMIASRDSDVLQIQMLQPGAIPTLDHGDSYIGVVSRIAQIDRADAAQYLAGQRSLALFYDLIVTGTLDVVSPREMMFYEGQPNHPMFMLPDPAAAQ